jgi:hypothetical protein
VRRRVSVLDQFRTAEEQVAKRLRELKPLVAEYHELEQLAQRLGLSLSEDAAVSSEPRRAAAKSTRRRRRASATKARSAAPTREQSGSGATAQTSAATTQTRRARSPGSSARKGRPGSSRTSLREQDVLRLVSQRPGITVSEIAKQLEVDPTGPTAPYTSSNSRARSPSRARRSSPPTPKASAQTTSRDPNRHVTPDAGVPKLTLRIS